LNTKLYNVFMNNQVFGDDRFTYRPLHEYCKGGLLPEVLMNHMCQQNQTQFFKTLCVK